MYDFLTGRLVEKTPQSLVLEAGGIGYQIQIPLGVYEELPEAGRTLRILTHFVVREDSQALYGFLHEGERRLFRLLLSVSGVGPKLAMTVLSGLPLPQLKRAIVEGSLASLKGISGIGKKTAERIIVELREKLVLDEQQGAGVVSTLPRGQQGLYEDSIQALVALGYRKPNAKAAVQKALQNPGSEKISVEELIRLSLKFVE